MAISNAPPPAPSSASALLFCPGDAASHPEAASLRLTSASRLSLLPLSTSYCFDSQAYLLPHPDLSMSPSTPPAGLVSWLAASSPPRSGLHSWTLHVHIPLPQSPWAPQMPLPSTPRPCHTLTASPPRTAPCQDPITILSSQDAHPLLCKLLPNSSDAPAPWTPQTLILQLCHEPTSPFSPSLPSLLSLYSSGPLVQR